MGEPSSKKPRVEGLEDIAARTSADLSQVTGIDEVERKSVDEMEALQAQIDKMNEEASEEILKVEQKFNQLRKPLFEKRNEIIQGIKHFWVATFVNHPQMSSILDEEEEQCLNSLAKLEVEEFDDIKSGFLLRFTFEPNDYFENTVIEKQYHLGSAEPTSESTPIKWKEDKDLAARSKRLRRSNTVFSRSFFEWLNEAVDPASDDISEVIKDDIWPNPLQYFLVAPEEQNGDNLLDDDDLEDEASGDDGEDEEDDEGEDGDDDEPDLVDEEVASDAENDENEKK